MKNGRCWVHGGPSSGPRTPEGLARSRKARWVHGLFSSQYRDDMLLLRAAIRALREMD
jgi:hypothetical protein